MPASWEAVGGTDPRWKSRRTAEAMLGGALTKFGWTTRCRQDYGIPANSFSGFTPRACASFSMLSIEMFCSPRSTFPT
jgi:hypothetical protein